MDTETVSLTLGQEELPQHDRLARLLVELAQEHGPIEPQVLEQARRCFGE